jgi:hypothetical protein
MVGECECVIEREKADSVKRETSHKTSVFSTERGVSSTHKCMCLLA